MPRRVTVSALVLFVFLIHRTAAQEVPPNKASDVDGGRHRAERIDIQLPITMNYQLFLPDGYDDKDAWPLIVFLHGAGERGDDLELVNTHGPLKIAQAKQLPFVVVAPQC